MFYLPRSLRIDYCLFLTFLLWHWLILDIINYHLLLYDLFLKKPIQDDLTLLLKQLNSMMKLQFYANHFYYLIMLLFFSSNPMNLKYDSQILSLFNLMMILITLAQIEQKLNDISIGFDQQILINLNSKLLVKFLNLFIISKKASTFMFIKLVYC